MTHGIRRDAPFFTHYVLRFIPSFLFPAAALAPAALAQPAAAPVAPDIEETLVQVVKQVTPAFVFIDGGSGVCVSEDGWILTNWHVVASASRDPMQETWRVVFAGGKRFRADVVGYSLRGDLAVLKVRDGKGLPFAELGDSDALAVGQYVFAVGNPFMLGARVWEPSVSFGIVSALHRFQEGYSDSIQTDAQINPGNSGGPLFTLDGKAVGINGRIALKYGNRVNTGIGYAIPSNQIKRFLPKLQAGGRVYHGFVEGLAIAEADVTGGEYGSGALVFSVEPGSAADQAGFEPGDLVVRIEGHRVFNTKRFHGVVGTYPAGATVTVTVRRTDGDKDLRVRLGERPPAAAVGPAALGLSGRRARGGEGLEVDEVEAGGPAAEADVRAGDILLEADGQPVKNYRRLLEILKTKKPGDELTLKVKRGSETIEKKVTLDEAEEDVPGPEGKEKSAER